MRLKSWLAGCAAFTAFMAFVAPMPCSAEVIRIAHIDAYSGPAAAINQNTAATIRYAIDLANKNAWAGPNVTFELVPFDNKNAAQDTLLQFKNATDQGIRYVFQGLSASVGLALIDAVNRFNERNPGKEVMFITASDQAAEMTNEKCSFWFFRFDSNSAMRSEGMTTFVARNKGIKKVYLINQNYATGIGISKDVKESLARKRPDIEIVGDEIHPFLQVKDFTPYVAKIRASGADAIVTGNWGPDLTLLVKAMKEADMKTPLYTFNGATVGVPTALATAGAENFKIVTYWIANEDPKASRPIVEPFKANYKEDFVQIGWYNTIQMLARAIKNSGSTEPLQVARALEGMKIASLNGEVEMRKSDHQVQQQLIMADWTKVNGQDMVFDLENTGWGFKPTDKIDPAAASTPTTCQMKRPG